MIRRSERRFAIGFEVTPRVGKRIRQDVLKEKRAEYGEEIVATLSQQLTEEYGAGWSRHNLARMVRFAEVFPDIEIVSALRRQLGWTHFKRIIYLDDSLKRDFYAEMCRIERWSTRTLEKKIGGMLFERTALSKKPKDLIRQGIARRAARNFPSRPVTLTSPWFSRRKNLAILRLCLESAPRFFTKERASFILPAHESSLFSAARDFRAGGRGGAPAAPGCFENRPQIDQSSQSAAL